MLIAQPPERGGGEVAIDDLGFLEAEDIGLRFPQKALDDLDAETNRIDVPGDDFERVGHAARCSHIDHGAPVRGLVDRKSVARGKSVTVRGGSGGRRTINKKIIITNNYRRIKKL